MSRLILFLLLATLLLGACGPQPQDCSRSDVRCAGLVTDFGGIDSGIARQAWLGLQDAKAAHLVDRIDAIETIDSRDRAPNIQALANEGYGVIVTTGAGIAAETSAAALKYPQVYFIGVEQPKTVVLPNLSGMVFHEEHGGFMAGVLAASMTQTGHVAAICDEKSVEPMRRYCDGFQAGALSVQPKINVTVTYREGSGALLFNDPEWGRTAALQAVNDGADVVFAAGGQTAVAALQAAAGQGAYVIGAETDQYLDLPTVRLQLLSSATNDVRSGIVQELTLLQRGRFPEGEFTGNVYLAPWHELDRQVPGAVKSQLSKISMGLNFGALDTGVPYRQP